jgi:hypothetical protein
MSKIHKAITYRQESKINKVQTDEDKSEVEFSPEMDEPNEKHIDNVHERQIIVDRDNHK